MKSTCFWCDDTGKFEKPLDDDKYDKAFDRYDKAGVFNHAESRNIITFYECNTGMLNENQLKILMLHELKHIGMGERGLTLVPHDIEDFSSILDKYGLDWNEYGKELPDLFGGE